MIRKFAFILKSRSCEQAARNPFRPKGQIRYSKWNSQPGRGYSSFEKAVAGLQKKRGQGLVDWGIFFKGKRVNEKDNPTQERPKVFWP